MALTKTLTLTNNFGTESILENVYVKITNLQGNKDLMEADVNLFPTINNEKGQSIQTRMVSFTPDLDGPNFIQQAYEHLKTLPEFADATDC